LKNYKKIFATLTLTPFSILNNLTGPNLPRSVQKIYQTLFSQIEDQLQTIELDIEELLSHHEELREDYQNLQTIPGIGKTTAVAILAEIPELSSLENARQLAAYAGLTPAHRSSGTFLKAKSRLSKMGSSSLRKALYFPAIVSKNRLPFLKGFSQKLARKGKHTMVIIGAIMRKLLHICFGILKNKTPFNPNILKI
jgi:transposase